MAEKPQSYYGTWINRQRSLLPGLDEELDPLTAKLEHLIIILDTLGLEAFVASPSRGRGRPPDDRPAIARSFVAKAVLTIPTTSALIERLQIDRARGASAAGNAAPRFPARQPSRAPLPSSPHKVCRNVCMSSSSAVICTITSSVISRAMPPRSKPARNPAAACAA